MKRIHVNSKLYTPQDPLFADIPPGIQKRFTGAHVRVTREDWPTGINYTLEDGSVASNVVALLGMEKTEDEGRSWIFVSMTTLHGGVKLNRDGTPITHDFLTSRFWGSDNQPLAQFGDLRFFFRPLVPLRTALDAEMFEEGDVVTASAGKK